MRDIHWPFCGVGAERIWPFCVWPFCGFGAEGVKLGVILNVFY